MNRENKAKNTRWPDLHIPQSFDTKIWLANNVCFLKKNTRANKMNKNA